jgi:hypothetical protein
MPFHFKTPNWDLMRIVLRDGQLPLSCINDHRLKSFLAWLTLYRIDDVVVVGGAVRDLFFAEPIKDIDITAKILTSAGPLGTRGQRLDAGLRDSGYAQAMRALGCLARSLGLRTSVFTGMRSPPKFMNLGLHYLGPDVSVGVDTKRRMISPGIFVDARTAAVFSMYTAPSLMQMGIDRFGIMYGYNSALQDALSGVVRLQGDLVSAGNLLPLAIVKWLAYKHIYGLRLCDSDYALARTAITAKSMRCDTRLAILIESLGETCTDREALSRDLFQIGLRESSGS